MTPDAGAGPDGSLASRGLPSSLLVAAAGVAASGVVFGVLAPLRGGVLSTALVTLLLLGVPGLLAAGLLRLESRLHSLASVVAVPIGLGCGIVVPFAGIALAQGWPLADAAQGLVAVEFAALCAWFALARRSPHERGFAGLRARPTSEWIADAFVFAAGIGLSLLFVHALEPAMRSGDLWYYLSYIDWMAQEPGRSYVPHSADPEEWNARLISSGFLAFEAMIVTLVNDPGGSLEVFWSWLPATFIPLALIAMVSLACALGSGAGTRIGLVAVQLVLVFATLGYLLDRDTSGVRWPGSVLFFRISQDKVFLAYVLAPIAARFGVEWLQRREARWLVALFITGAGCVVTHPLGLPFVAMLTLPYAVATAVLAPANEAGVPEPHARRWRAVLALALAIAPLALWPLSQRSEEGAPNTLADEAGFARRAHLTIDSLDIVSREHNDFTAHTSLIAHPMIVGGIVCGLGLGLVSRRRADARYAFALMLAPLVMLYTPGVAPLAGSIVTPYLLWRFTWLLPVALSVAVATTWLASIAQRAFGDRIRGASVLAAASALAVFGLVTSVPYDLAKARDTVEALFPAPFDSTTARRLIGGIAEIVPREDTILLDPSLQTLAISLAPGMQTVYWRWGSDPVLYQRVIDLFEARFLSNRHLELLREHEVQWLGVRRRSALIHDVRRRSDLFEPAGNVETIFLFRVRDLARAGQLDDPIDYWRKRADAAPDAESFTALALALIGEGRTDEARGLLDRATALDPDHAPAYEWSGTLQLLAGDYASAARELGRAVELDAQLRTATNNLAWLLATCPDERFRDPERALALATALIEDGIDGGSLDTLAAAQAATGDFAAATRSLRRALDIYESSGANAEQTEPLRRRLALYAARRAFIDTAPR